MSKLTEVRGLLRLTDWETGKPVYVRLSDVVVVERLPAKTYELGTMDLRELGERTKIVTRGELSTMLLVRETPEEIMEVET